MILKSPLLFPHNKRVSLSFIGLCPSNTFSSWVMHILLGIISRGHWFCHSKYLLGNKFTNLYLATKILHKFLNSFLVALTVSSCLNILYMSLLILNFSNHSLLALKTSVPLVQQYFLPDDYVIALFFYKSYFQGHCYRLTYCLCKLAAITTSVYVIFV